VHIVVTVDIEKSCFSALASFLVRISWNKY